MNKKKIFAIPILLHTIQLFASDMTGHGRISSGHNDFTGVIIAILAIGLGGIFAYFFISDGIKNGVSQNKEWNKFGCGAIILCIIGLSFLVAMCSQ